MFYTAAARNATHIFKIFSKIKMLNKSGFTVLVNDECETRTAHHLIETMES